MYHNILLALIYFVIMCNNTDSLFILDSEEVGREKNSDEGYFYMIRSRHALKKRDVYSIDTVSVPAGGPRDETIIVMPNSGTNYPSSNYYPTNPFSRYGANSGTTVIGSNPDSNYNSYGTKYIPNRYG
ncbi:uncharacterized protein [Maniola hyperantus]|uniref:uncharacterized protein n=1 Tax=Aphantopus hyperantus TaxID=2795564 RepID=UPI00156A27FE|nr:uncharacterized protein LOC117993134 [Maniola hyperantus]